MAVEVRFITTIVRIDAIEAKVIGGWEGWSKKYADIMGKLCWHDDHLFAISWMNYNDSVSTTQEYTELGLTGLRRMPDGTHVWEDMCVLEMWNHPTNCPWLESVGDELLGPAAVEFCEGRETDFSNVTEEQMAKIRTCLSKPLNSQREVFDRLQLNVADFDAADDIIEDIDDDTWVSVISLLSGDDTVYAVVKVQVWGQAGGIFGDFFGFFETRNAIGR